MFRRLQPAVVVTVLTNYSIIQLALPVTLIGSVCVAERPCLLDAVHWYIPWSGSLCTFSSSNVPFGNMCCRRFSGRCRPSGSKDPMAEWLNTFTRNIEESVGRDSSVGIVTRYELDRPWIESRWGRDIPHPSRPALWPTQPPIQSVLGVSQGVKRPGRGVDHPPPPSAEVKERVELYLYPPSAPSWPVLGWSLPLLYLHTGQQLKYNSKLI